MEILKKVLQQSNADDIFEGVGSDKHKLTTEKRKMTTATSSKIRRNADGQQNLSDLRKALAATKHSVYKQGGNWITSEWSEARGCYMTETCPHYWTERQAIQSILGEVESADEARYHAGK